MHLYMLYEGRRYWPNKVWLFCLNCQKRRLEKLIKQQEEYKRRKENKKEIGEAEYAKYLERSVELRRFPMDDRGQYCAIMPTRLGNLLASYEGYPLRIYGMDSYFYWYRIWLTLNNDLQEQIDNQQAIADSTIYMAFALLCTGLLCVIYAYITFLGVTLIKYLPSERVLLGLGFLAFMGSYFLYRVSLHLHSHFGEIFKSVFDVFRDKISIDEIINDLTQITENPELTKLPCKDRFKIAWRYLHNYRIKVKDGQAVPPHLFQKQKMDNK